MCNTLKHDATPIAEEGYGYKVFTSDERGLFTAVGITAFQDTCIKKKTVSWNTKKFGHYGDGFCFFLNKETAVEAMEKWINETGNTHLNTVTKKIHYHEGIGTFKDSGLAHGKIQYALCRKFTVLGGKLGC